MIYNQINGIDKMVNLCNLLTMPTMREVKARNFRRIREKLNLKQWQIAEILNIKESNVSEMERAKRAISDRTIDILCKKLNISANEFIIEENTPFPVTDLEKRALFIIREAEKLNKGKVTEELINYTARIIEIEKKEAKKELDKGKRVRYKAGGG